MNTKEKVVFVGLDASKATLAVSVADDGRDGEIRDWGTISTAPNSVERFLKKLAARFDRVEICYEAGPTGYGLYRQITAFGLTCYVIAPSLIPMRSGDRIKTDRRDGVISSIYLVAMIFAIILLPSEADRLRLIVFIPGTLGEISLGLWLALKGATPGRA